MRRWRLAAVWVLALTVLVIGGCGGKKDAESVLGDLSKKIESMQGYRGVGTLTIATGAHPIAYAVEVSHKKPQYYRVVLSNEESGVKQVILKNDDGVFVVTPHLNKTYRFQSDWPQNQSQIYLFESLVKNIADDPARVFTPTEQGYLYHVKAQYQNRLLVTQKIWFDGKTLAPRKVEVLDADERVLVSLVFDRFEWNPSLTPDDFKDTKTSGSSDAALPDAHAPSAPTMAGGDDQDRSAAVAYREPSYRPNGMVLIGVDRKGDGSYALTYGGTHRLTISAAPARSMEVVAPVGEPVMVGGSIGVITETGELTALRFTDGGVDYKLTTVDLPKEELVRVAESLLVAPEK
ncbi:MAG: outer membrane lipoprotein carrier protein LolA [Hydrogenibacillus sp.]|nr:outer membrane lipoprotein carrier protein LolA [Hydrogenibacillus sp.]